jgi:polyphosphate kinase
MPVTMKIDKRKPLRFRAAGVAPSAQASAEVSDASLFINREQSWLDFNRRVLEEAKDPSNPLLERLKFVAIFGSNLDEFFMKRIGGLKQQAASNLRELTPDGRTPRQQLEEINAAVRPMVQEQHRVFREELVPALKKAGLEILRWGDLGDGERAWLRRFFDEQVLPVLTPLALDPAHPFPFISNLSLSLAVAVRNPESGQEHFARVKVPESIARWVQLPDSLRFVALEDVIAQRLDQLFRGMEVVEAHCFRVTRNADLQFDDDPAEDLLRSIQEELRERRFAKAVRLQVVAEMPAWMRALLCEELRIGPEDVFEVPAPLALGGLMPLSSVPLWPLRFEPWRGVTPPPLQPNAEGEYPDIFQAIAKGDILVHHPYDSFATSVQRFIQTAARDQQVLAIKQTLYRTQVESPIVSALIEAAEAGKQVAVTVELKARFDEQRNIDWARKLEEAGAHVTYGLVGFKTHAKVALVVRQEGATLRSYAHLATGNYNAATAALYTDVGLFTCRPEITADVAQLFNLLTGYVLKPEFAKLLVAPANMRRRFEELIEREIEHRRAGRPGRIVAKMNALEDQRMVRALYRAAAAGVEIELIVRGVCRLRPGVPGVSDTIRVQSIVGRLLEHARIFQFGNGGDPEVWIGSADWMARNLDDRVEAVVPVEDPALREELRQVLEIQLADNVKGWDLRADGTWQRRRPAGGEAERSSQHRLMERATARWSRGAGDRHLG